MPTVVTSIMSAFQATFFESNEFSIFATIFTTTTSTYLKPYLFSYKATFSATIKLSDYSTNPPTVVTTIKATD
jgi:hypothetical protein